ncbi:MULTISPECIES: formyltransferase family protein [Kiloniella]|uniref:formyltransferase family protein n=1 Tax=Kiloniellaceae TaxID=597359 RepID=UPI0031D3EC4E
MLRVVLFTTPTKHHTYFINRLRKSCHFSAIVYERKKLSKPFATGPFFLQEEDRFEDRFFDPDYNGVSSELAKEDEEKIVSVHDVNQTGLAHYIEALQPDLGISFGTGKIKPDVFSVPRLGTINVHRGLTQYHRGLDSDLWAIHQDAFDQIGVTIHSVDAELDTGHILRQDTMPLSPEDEIYHIRYKTSVMATDMVEDVLKEATSHNAIISGKPQLKKGPYFSAMTLEQKMEAADKFTAFKKKTFMSSEGQP